MNRTHSSIEKDKMNMEMEDELAESLYTIGWFSVSNDPVITSEKA